MLFYVHMMICVICTVLHGRYCVIQHSCCNTNKTIIIIIIIIIIITLTHTPNLFHSARK